MNFKSILCSAAVLLPVVATAQQKAATPDLTFTTVVANPITSIKNQASSSTCWCFSTMAFLESEAIRINNIKDAKNYPDFSEMFVVNHSYQERAAKYVRLDGNLNFGPGSEPDDALHIMKDYGLVPQSIQEGLNYGTTLPSHSEMDASLLTYIEGINKRASRGLTAGWKNGFKGIVDAYLGECPESFEYNGKTMTPAEYRDSYKLNSDDYVSLTSFTHHPFYTKFALEISDNWRWDESYNVPLDVFMDVLYNAVKNGYTAVWGTDVSEAGFTRDGIGLLLDPNAGKAPAAGSDQEHWVGPAAPQAAAQAKPAGAPKEIVPTQEWRQEGYDNKSTTDDHGMQIYGIAKDQYGNEYFMVKNSWGETGKYKGIWYVSKNFVAGKSMDYTIHKDALPKDLKKKLGIN
ncbi:MAG: C1 family peptidase [Bacteroidales bacterium]|nr:C1 family peptidase [Bacteroidales bacterium]